MCLSCNDTLRNGICFDSDSCVTPLVTSVNIIWMSSLGAVMCFKRCFVNKPFLCPLPSIAIVPGAQANAINEPALCMALRPTGSELLEFGSRESTCGLRK